MTHAEGIANLRAEQDLHRTGRREFLVDLHREAQNVIDNYAQLESIKTASRASAAVTSLASDKDFFGP